MESREDDRNDETLMRAWQRGEVRAFEVLYRRHRGTLFRFLVRQSGSVAIGEELYQDVWYTLIRGRERWQPTASLKTWLFRIAHSRLVDHFRRNRLLTAPLDDESEVAVDDCPACDPASDVVRRSQADALRFCLEALPREQREAFLFSEEAGLSLADIATITEVGSEAVKSRIRYAIQKLRACLADRLEVT